MLSPADFEELDILLWPPDLLDLVFFLLSPWLMFIWEGDRHLLLGNRGLQLVMVCESRKALSGLLDEDCLDGPESSGDLESFFSLPPTTTLAEHSKNYRSRKFS